MTPRPSDKFFMVGGRISCISSPGGMGPLPVRKVTTHAWLKHLNWGYMDTKLVNLTGQKPCLTIQIFIQVKVLLYNCQCSHRLGNSLPMAFHACYPVFLDYLYAKVLHLGPFVEKVGKCRLSNVMLNVGKKGNSGAKYLKFNDWSQNSYTFCQFVMFHDFSMTFP